LRKSLAKSSSNLGANIKQPKELEVPEVVKRLFDAMDSLSDSISILTTRLAPVLIANKDVSGIAKPPVFNCPHATNLAELLVALYNARARIMEATGALQI
jgi:hypothetical protein